MNKQRTLRLFSHSFLMLFIAVLSASTVQAQEFTGDVANGKSLFNGQCAACHKLDKKVVGPALGDVTTRRSKEWLYAWIKDNQALRESGDADAIAIYEEYNGSIMPAYFSFGKFCFLIGSELKVWNYRFLPYLSMLYFSELPRNTVDQT